MNSSGLYVEELATVRTYYTDWKLVTYINLTKYNEEYFNLKSLLGKATSICQIVDINFFGKTSYDFDNLFSSGCNQTLKQVYNLMDELDEYHSKWFLPEVRNLKKRALDSVGEGLKYMFGTLSNSDALYYLKEFETIYNNTNLQNDIIKKQTSLVNSAINLMKKYDFKFNTTVEHILTTINKFHAKHHKSFDLAILKININELFNHITLAFIRFINNQKIYLNAISFGKNNINNPNIIPPKVFFTELTKIHSKITAMELDLPLPLEQESLALFYKISKAESRLINNQLIISFTLPLVNTKKYILYKSTSLPYLVKDNLYSFIIPHHDYVALDKVKDKYIPITNQELEQCFRVSDVNLICLETFPIMSAIGTRICEINLLRMDKVSDECNIRVANLSAEVWIKLQQPNAYIFVFPMKQFVYISCPLRNYDMYFEGTGIIYFEPGCTIKSNYIILHAYETITSITYRHFTPIIQININMSQIIGKISAIENFQVPKIEVPNIISFNDHDTLQEISYSLKKINEMEKELVYNLSPTELKSNIFGLFMAIIIILIIVLIIYGKYFYKKGMKIRNRRLQSQLYDTPTPMPSISITLPSLSTPQQNNDVTPPQPPPNPPPYSHLNRQVTFHKDLNIMDN